MEGKKDLILTIVPFVILIILGSLFIGTYHWQGSVAKKGIAAIDELEGIGKENASWDNPCSMMTMYVTVRDRNDAKKLEEFLRENNIEVAVRRDGKRYLSMNGRAPLNEVEEFVDKSREKGWGAFYHNNSDSCARLISESEMESRIIVSHLNQLSPGNREVLGEVLKEDRKFISEFKNGTEAVELDIMVETEPPYTPEEFHGLSRFLVMWGVLLEVPFLLWWIEDKK